jgi:methyl-accepting chemotaxis protein
LDPTLILPGKLELRPEKEISMNWFKNLNAMPRLMCSFGIMIALTLGTGYLGIDRLSQSNDRLGTLYQSDMKGATIANDITISRLSLGRQVRDAMLKIKDPAAVAADEKTGHADLAKIHASLDEADSAFYVPEGKALIATLRQTLPGYEKAVGDAYQHIDAQDLDGAMTALDAITTAGQPLYNAADQARLLKERLAEEKYQANEGAFQSARAIMLSAAVICMVLGLVLGFLIARGFSVPLAKAVTALEQLAGGDLTVALDVDTQDEMGRMAAALNIAVQKLGDTMSEVADSAAHANSSSQQLAAAAEAIASGAQEQAASLEETSASLEEMTAAVRQSADNANQASQLAITSKDSAQMGQEVVSNAIVAMTEINASSSKISEIISTIDEIAFQTNLLAVNAAVEAARAGEEGRGFAVVASEVRSLAQRSSVAAKEIKGLIQDSLSKVGAGSSLVNRSGETLQGIVGSVKRVTDIVGEIAATSGEQSSGIEQINRAMTQMDQATQSNSAQTEELSATAQVLSEQAAQLMELVGKFVLSSSGRNAHDRQSSRSREPGRAQPVGASLAQSARSASTLSTNSSRFGQGTQRAAKATRSFASARAGATAPSAAVATVASASDASFEEF